MQETEESIAEFSKFCLEIQLANNFNNDENKLNYLDVLQVDTPLPDISSNHLRSLACADEAHSQGCIYQNSFNPLS
ncbi:hypothetical protein RhiirA1_484864 [Rhizophagus irregularis]|uniref:Uncharacterized protein n=1 Tax=Rhizophagus irregularis TaxID=588596 RepID=A0A2I1FDM1_9GLOM|nr:hypothetical protein RhiirA1_484864 [Rhizophagus irregularis]PKY32446.1 hypothetical protein RhiirB3_450626 [Rhizophagus irregularis]